MLLSFLASAHQKLCLWKTNRALGQRGLPDLLVVSAVCKALSQAAWPQGAHGEPGSGDGLPALVCKMQSASSGCLTPSSSQPFWPTACLWIVSWLVSTFPHQSAGNPKGGQLPQTQQGSWRRTQTTAKRVGYQSSLPCGLKVSETWASFTLVLSEIYPSPFCSDAAGGPSFHSLSNKMVEYLPAQ